MQDLADWSAVDLLAAYRSKQLSPRDVVSAVLSRIEAWEPRLHASYAVDAESAMAAARESEKRWQSGRPCGELDGVPITVKENIATRGTPVPLGSAATQLVPAAEDGPPAARVREAGAIMLGKTTMPEYGMLVSGLSTFYPLTRNPWDLTKSPGGSSAGAGAAAAAGYGPLHIGTDLAGSIRLPAAWCGIVGLKPSFGLVPVDPPFIGRVAGPMARTVADTALLMQALSEPDCRDHMSLPYSCRDWSALDRDPKGCKIGVLLDAGTGLPVDTEIKAAVEAAADKFAEAGALVHPAQPFLTPAMIDGVDCFWRARYRSDIARLPTEQQARILPFIYEWAEAADKYTGFEVYRGFSRMLEISAAAIQSMQQFDYLLTPTAPILPYAAEQPCPSNDPARPFEHVGFTIGFNMSGQPAVSLNCGYTRAGLPIGLQIVGHRFDDLGVLRMARAYEKMRPAQHPWPHP
jgi:aspartyl-tRNA(Asn)/glutamyl-tRNA(Gln) amidotransferase subunit A